MVDFRKYRVNERITAQSVRVISPKGENLGVLSKLEALGAARREGLDLVEIAGNTNPPVAKILDFKKFLYEEKKKASAAKAHSKQTELKEFKFGPHIGANDLNIRIERAKQFLINKDRVKFTVQFSGRQIVFPQIGREKINKVVGELSDLAKPEEPPKLVHKNLSVTLLPK